MTDDKRRSLSIHLQNVFGTSLIPYESVTKELFDCEKNTALSLMEVCSSMGLKTLKFSEGCKAPLYIFVSDLADFLLTIGSKQPSKLDIA